MAAGTRGALVAALVLVGGICACSSSKKHDDASEKPKSGSEALATKAADAGVAPEVPISPVLKPSPSAIAAETRAAATHHDTVPPDAPGVCKTDSDCGLGKDGLPQRCCIQQPGVVAPGPALGCQAAKAACWLPCATDSDCPVRSECKRVPGAATVLRGCGHV